jgi:hypothetical protein
VQGRPGPPALLHSHTLVSIVDLARRIERANPPGIYGPVSSAGGRFQEGLEEVGNQTPSARRQDHVSGEGSSLLTRSSCSSSHEAGSSMGSMCVKTVILGAV